MWLLERRDYLLMARRTSQNLHEEPQANNIIIFDCRQNKSALITDLRVLSHDIPLSAACKPHILSSPTRALRSVIPHTCHDPR